MLQLYVKSFSIDASSLGSKVTGGYANLGGVGHCWQLQLMRNSKEVYFAITSFLEGT